MPEMKFARLWSSSGLWLCSLLLVPVALVTGSCKDRTLQPKKKFSRIPSCKYMAQHPFVFLSLLLEFVVISGPCPYRSIPVRAHAYFCYLV
jgi:hypothetical protein